MLKDDDKIRLVIDLKQGRPACVLIQAVFGCGSSNGFLQQTFASKHWLVAPTSDMSLVQGTEAEWKQLADKLRTK